MLKELQIIKSTKGLQWVDLDYDSMINHLNKHLHSLPFSSLSTDSPPTKGSTPKESKQNRLAKRMRNLFKMAIPSLPKKNIPHVTETKENPLQNKHNEVDVAIANADSSNTPSLGGIWEIVNFSWNSLQWQVD